MTTKFMKLFNKTNRRGGGANLNLFRYAAMVLVLFVLGIGNAWAGGGGSSTYYSQLQAIGSTGKGYVYASKSSGDTPAYVTSSDSEKTSSSTSQNEDTYYAWAKAVRGSVFTGWSTTSGSPKVSGSSNPYTVKVKESSSADGTNTGKITANWSTYTKVNVTYNPSEDGSYSVTYQYDSYNSSSKTITSGDAEGLSRTITSDDGAQTIPSYHNDIVTLQSVSGDFQGWYSDESCTTPLTGVTDNGGNPKTYTYEVPESGTVSIYAKYPHVDKYYGRLTVSIAAVPYSMPGGGTIFATKDPGVVGTYSDAIDPILNTSFGSTSQTFYLYAQPTDKRYVFRGWYSNAQCTGTPLSTNKEYTYSFTASSTNSTSPTEGNVYAAFDFNLYYMQVDAQPATSGLGMVLVRDNNTGTPEYGEYSSLSSQFAYAYRLAPTATVYLYAKPKYGYKFSGWYDNPECTGTAIGTSNPQTYAATGTSTDPLNPTIVPVYAKFVPAADGDKISITYNIPDQTKGEYTASVLDIEEVDDEYVWIFTEVYNSADYTANKTISQYKTDVLRLESDPKAGYGVTSWSIAGTTKTTPSQLYETSATTTGKAYGVVFGEARPFLVSASASDKTGTAYSTLREALDNIGSNKKITVVQNAYVPAGNYEIPSGVTLLVPYNSDYAIGTNQPTKSSGTTAPTPYCMLTIASGAHINVKGAISVNAIIRDQQNSNTAPTGTCGMITMESGSQIELQSGANMYVWGCVLGTGDITAHSGSTVYEALQANDYPGGTFLSLQNSNLKSKKIFPIRIYCIPNIQAYLHIEYGAQEKLSAAFASMDAVHNIEFIGSSAGLFRLTSGATLTKWYDKANDRQRYSVRGNASIENISLKIQNAVTVNSGDYLMPLTHNMQIEVLSGTTTIKKDIEMLPGAIVAVEKDATITINSTAAVHVYDKDEWNINHTFANGVNKSVIYGRSKNMSYAKADLADAKLDVKGSVIVNGALYTTATGGNITGSEGGIVTVNALGTKTVINQVYEKGSTSQEYHTVDISAAKLHNGDGSYVATAGSTSGDKFIYSEEQDKWLKNPMTVTWNANGGNCDVKSNVYSQTAFLGELPAAYKEGYTLAGWFTTADGGTQITQTTKVTANATYYAHWTPKQYDITYMDQGKAAFSSTHIDSPNAHPTTHTYGTATTLNGVNNKSNALFDGWHTISNCKAESKVTSLGATAVTKDITLYAKWIPLYTLTVAATPEGYGTVSASSVANVPEGSAVTVSGNTFTVNGMTVTATPATQTAQYTYTFDHWNSVPETVTAAATIQAVFTRATRSYDVTFDLQGHGSAIDGQTKEYGAKVMQPSDPSEMSYTFGGWYKEPGCENKWNFESDVVTGETTLYAKWTILSYSLSIGVNEAQYGSVDVTSIPNIPYGSAVTKSGNTITVNGTTVTATPTANTAQYTYAFSTWIGVPETVTAAATIQAIFSRVMNTYTITWLDYNGTLLGTSEVVYGYNPAHDNPTKSGCTFAGWKAAGTGVVYAAGAELPAVGYEKEPGVRVLEETYTAQYNCALGDITVDSETSLEVNTSAETTTVEVSGSLTITNDATLTTTGLILKASAADNGKATSGEIVGNVDASDYSYFEYTHPNGFKERTWYAVAVPWQVDVPEYAAGGVYILPDGESSYVQQYLGSTYDLIYYDGDRRAREGHSDDCWKYIEDDNADEQVMIPGRAYMIYLTRDAQTIRFVKKAEADLQTTSVDVVAYASKTGSDMDASWNGIANPATYKAYLNVHAQDNTYGGVNYAQVYIAEERRYEPIDLSANKLAVGQAIFVQPEAAKTVVANNTAYNPSQAPRRMTSAAAPLTHYEVMLAPSDGDVTDRVIVRMNEYKEKDDYMIAQDLCKMGISTSVPQMWVNRYNSQMCINTTAPINNQADYPLGINVLHDGEYELFIDDQPNDETMIYVTRDGEAVWNLSYGGYTMDLKSGTNTQYGLRIVYSAPAITTGIEETTIQNGEAIRKVLVNDQVYIIRNGEIYTITGAMIK